MTIELTNAETNEPVALIADEDGTFYIPPGIYYCSNLMLPSNTKLGNLIEAPAAVA